MNNRPEQHLIVIGEPSPGREGQIVYESDYWIVLEMSEPAVEPDWDAAFDA